MSAGNLPGRRRLRCSNESNNPDPDATVVWGAMDSTEEMFGARVLLKVPVSGDPRARSTSVTVPVTP